MAKYDFLQDPQSASPDWIRNYASTYFGGVGSRASNPDFNSPAAQFAGLHALTQPGTGSASLTGNPNSIPTADQIAKATPQQLSDWYSQYYSSLKGPNSRLIDSPMGIAEIVGGLAGVGLAGGGLGSLFNGVGSGATGLPSASDIAGGILSGTDLGGGASLFAPTGLLSTPFDIAGFAGMGTGAGALPGLLDTSGLNISGPLTGANSASNFVGIPGVDTGIAGGGFGTSPALTTPSLSAANPTGIPGADQLIQGGGSSITGQSLPAAPSSGFNFASAGGTPGIGTGAGYPLGNDPLFSGVSTGADTASQGGLLSSVESGAKKLLGSLSLKDLVGLGMTGYQALKGAPTVPFQSQLSQGAGASAAVGNQLIGDYQAGKLEPGQQSVIDQFKQQAIAAARQSLVNSGQGVDSSAMATMTADVEQRAATLAGQFMQQNLQSGLQAIGQSNTQYAQLANMTLNSDQQAQQTLAAFMAAFFGLGSGQKQEQPVAAAA